MKIGDVKHELVSGYHFKIEDAAEHLENYHPLGTVYDSGNGHGYVKSGYDWLSFDLKHLNKIERAMRRDPEGVAQTETYRQMALEYLRRYLYPGATCYTLAKEHRRSGAVADAYLAISHLEIVNISDTVAAALDLEYNNGAVIVGYSFSTVCRLSYALHGYKSNGPQSDGCSIATPTLKKFTAGYSLVHKAL